MCGVWMLLIGHHTWRRLKMPLLRVENMEMIKFNLPCKHMKWLVTTTVIFISKVDQQLVSPWCFDFKHQVSTKREFRTEESMAKYQPRSFLTTTYVWKSLLIKDYYYQERTNHNTRIYTLKTTLPCNNCFYFWVLYFHLWFFLLSRLINTYENWMLTWLDLSQISRNNMQKKLASQIMKVRFLIC